MEQRRGGADAQAAPGRAGRLGDVRASGARRASLPRRREPGRRNRTLRASLARFEECCARLRLLTERVDAYESALLRADDNFEQAEAQAVRYAEAIDVVSYAKTPVSRSNGFRWEPASVAYMASLRESAPPMPDWLDALLN